MFYRFLKPLALCAGGFKPGKTHSLVSVLNSTVLLYKQFYKPEVFGRRFRSLNDPKKFKDF